MGENFFPKVSVIIPVYNVEKYLRECMESVVRQTLREIEIICVNDGSTDSSLEILQEYAARDSRVKIIDKENSGYGAAMNVGMNAASGEYIGIVESDDFAEPQMFEVLYESAKKYDAQIVKGAFRKIYSNGGEWIVAPPFPFYKNEVLVEPEYSLDLMVMESSIWSGIYKRNFLLQNKIKMIETKGAAYQDSVFKFMVYAKCKDVLCLDKCVYNYRVMTQSSSSKSTKNWDAIFKNYAMLKEWLLQQKLFEDFCDAFYLHGYFDFIFHWNRISEETKPLFLKEAKKFYAEGNECGIGKQNERFASWEVRNFYWGTVKPFLENLESDFSKNENPKKPQKESWNITKKILRAAYKSRLGKKAWEKFAAIMRKPFFWKKLSGGIDFHSASGACGKANEIFCCDIKYPLEMDEPFFQRRKNALVLFPFNSTNASFSYMASISALLKKNGFSVHLFIYWNNDFPGKTNKEIFDRVFYMHCQNPYFSHTNFHPKKLDNDRIDDWLDEDFSAAIVRLCNHYRYSLCLANYLIYSKAFLLLPKSVRKVLVTHDKFLHHNLSLKNAGFPSWSFWLGVKSEKEEARALLRADVVLAIQEDDAKYFKKITKEKVEVLTFPFIPKKSKILPQKKMRKFSGPLFVGYIASGNPPNYFSLKKLSAHLKNSSRVKIFVAGSVCDLIKKGELAKNFKILGRVDSLSQFYGMCDIYFNADTFYSGFKCKTIEAMSYGVAIACTKVAATGISLSQEYHNFKDEKEVADFLKNVAAIKSESRKKLLLKMRAESSLRYDEFTKKYELDFLAKKIIGEN